MKRKIFFIALIIGLAAIVSAQEGSRRERSTGRSSANQTVTMSGVLVVANGMPALKSGDDTYLIGGISRLIGFVDGLKEGAQVTVEGRVVSFSRNNTLKYLQASKLTLGGKSYDLSSSLGMLEMMGMGMMNFNPNRQFSLPNLPNAPSAPRGPMRNQVPQAPQRFNRR